MWPCFTGDWLEQRYDFGPEINFLIDQGVSARRFPVDSDPAPGRVNIACVGITFACCPKAKLLSDNMEYDSNMLRFVRRTPRASSSLYSLWHSVLRTANFPHRPSGLPTEHRQPRHTLGRRNHGLFFIAMIKPRDNEVKSGRPFLRQHSLFLLANGGSPESDE